MQHQSQWQQQGSGFQQQSQSQSWVQAKFPIFSKLSLFERVCAWVGILGSISSIVSLGIYVFG